MTLNKSLQCDQKSGPPYLATTSHDFHMTNLSIILFGSKKGLVFVCSPFKKNPHQWIVKLPMNYLFPIFVMCKFDTYESSPRIGIISTWCSFPFAYGKLSTTNLLSWLANVGTIFSLGDRSISFMTRFEKLIELVESSQLVTKRM
jgi:hypothetical protein